MSDTTLPEGTPADDGLGTDSTIPNTSDGIALGHDSNGSNFNQEEDARADEVEGAYTDSDLGDGEGTTSTDEEGVGEYTDSDLGDTDAAAK